MALYWNISERRARKMQEADAKGNPNLIPIWEKNKLDRRAEVPNVPPKYIKYIEDPENTGSLFPAEMSPAEKIIADSQELEYHKKQKGKEIKEEAARRIENEDEKSEGGDFLNISDNDQRFKLGLSIILLKKALDLEKGGNGILSSLTQEEQDLFSALVDDFDRIKSVRDKAYKIIDEEVTPATTLEEVKSVKSKGNPKWLDQTG